MGGGGSHVQTRRNGSLPLLCSQKASEDPFITTGWIHASEPGGRPSLLTQGRRFPPLSVPLASPLPFLTNSCSPFPAGSDVTSLARPSPVPRQSAAVLAQVPVMPQAVVICLGPSPPTGLRRSTREHILSVRLPRGGTPHSTPRHLRDSGEVGLLMRGPVWVPWSPRNHVAGASESRGP